MWRDVIFADRRTYVPYVHLPLLGSGMTNETTSLKFRCLPIFLCFVAVNDATHLLVNSTPYYTATKKLQYLVHTVVIEIPRSTRKRNGTNEKRDILLSRSRIRARMSRSPCFARRNFPASKELFAVNIPLSLPPTLRFQNHKSPQEY